MKLNIDQLKALAAKNAQTSKTRVADVMINSGKPLSKTEIAALAGITGARPEHNVSTQMTHLRTDGYTVKEVEPSLYMILTLPDGNVPPAAEDYVRQLLGMDDEA